MRLQDDAAARHALADVIVRLTLEMQMQAARVPDAETLPGGAPEIDDERRRAHSVVAPALRDLAGYSCADGAVVVADRIGELAARSSRNGLAHIAQHLLRQ